MKDYKLLNDKEFVKWLIIAIISFLIVLTLPFILHFPNPFNETAFDFSNSGNIGDTIGGVTAPFIGIILALLTFAAFWVQYRTNQEQFNQFELQSRDIAIQRFESTYYELIKIHRENVNEIKISESAIGRAAFEQLFYEIKIAYYVATYFYDEDYDYKTHFNDNSKTRVDLEKIKLIYTFHLFFFGLNLESYDLFNTLFPSEYSKLNIEENLKKFKRLLSSQITNKYKLENLLNYNENRDINRYTNKMNIDKQLTKYHKLLTYTPLEGHYQTLGHYFRHLYQTVKFVDNCNIIFNSNQTENQNIKYNYVKTLRAQLSGFEQAILFFDCFGIAGKAWIKDGYFEKYCFIKHLPRHLINFGINPELYFET
ncbi:MAG: putative phage abortive infection protein [Bacteroidota bacterium]|nr:putative phage abortive infection protein [Bacteroidota bacterium]